MVFSDWDEIFAEDIEYLKHKGYIPKEASFEYINEGFHRGFKNKDHVILNDNSKKRIVDVRVGDILKNNNKIIGTVELLTGKHCLNNLEERDIKYNLITEKGIINVNGIVKIDYDAALFYIFGY